MNKFVCLVVNAEVKLDVEHLWGVGGRREAHLSM